jgi:GlpG protein
MRQLATLPSAGAARALADYLLTLKIETRLLPESDGWAVWVCDEDRLDQARGELAAFQENPHDARFAGAGRAAESLRQQRAREADRPAPRRVGRPAELGGHFRVTAALVTASVLASFATHMGDFRENPLARELTIAPIVEGNGGLYVEPLSSGLRQGQVWRLVTPIFLHLGIWHLVLNMVLFYQLGGQIEERRGWWRMLLLVLACAVPSNLAQYYLGHMTLDQGQVHLRVSPLFGGMSGVVYGLFGYVWMKSVFEPKLGLGMHPSTVLYLLVWFFLCMSSEFQKMTGVSVANMAHGVGLLAGMAIGVGPAVGRILSGGLRRGG